MISHFQWKALHSDKKLPGWSFSFFFKGVQYRGIYHKNGEIEWNEGSNPSEDDREKLHSHIHELMLYHVYED